MSRYAWPNRTNPKPIKTVPQLLHPRTMGLIYLVAAQRKASFPEKPTRQLRRQAAQEQAKGTLMQSRKTGVVSYLPPRPIETADDFIAETYGPDAKPTAGLVL